ncbi:MAG: 3-methyl-2-oxobutanoate hydroxymethyltransferase [Candidatus Delongbacteria bacterium]|nr:3-methyl-2-oxobutanoate hydroxymethyltransferase [Candidatus Delongbacteria bacterium]
MSKEGKLNKITVPQLQRLKEQGEKISVLTAYDLLFATLEDQAGVDCILVGDSVGMVFAGYENTLPVTLDEMIYHTRAVRRGVKRALLVTDMPFLTFQISPRETLRNAGRIMQEGGAEAVKIEGAYCETVELLTKAGIPVMGHLGLTPQSIHQFGGYSLRGKSDSERQQIIQAARDLETAGCFSLVLEKIPADLATEISAMLKIPTIGIGAGVGCDGQVLVNYDMLGLFEDFKPRFVRHYAQLAEEIRQAVAAYVQDIKLGNFPGEKESF